MSVEQNINSLEVLNSALINGDVLDINTTEYEIIDLRLKEIEKRMSDYELLIKDLIISIDENLLGYKTALEAYIDKIDVLNNGIAQLLPARAKFGQPLEPVSVSRETINLIDYKNITINRVGVKNSKIKFYDNNSKLVKLIYDVDYSYTLAFAGYQYITVEFDTDDYTIERAN